MFVLQFGINGLEKKVAKVSKSLLFFFWCLLVCLCFLLTHVSLCITLCDVAMRAFGRHGKTEAKGSSTFFFLFVSDKTTCQPFFLFSFFFLSRARSSLSGLRQPVGRENTHSRYGATCETRHARQDSNACRKLCKPQHSLFAPLKLDIIPVTRLSLRHSWLMRAEGKKSSSYRSWKEQAKKKTPD